LSYPEIEPNEEDRIRHFLADLTIVPLDNAIENMAIKLRRVARLKLPDAIVAATAVAMKATLLTADQCLIGFEWPGFQVMTPA